MIIGNVEIFIENDRMMRVVKVWAESSNGAYRTNYHYDSVNKTIEETKIDGCIALPAESLKPLIELPDNLFKVLLKGFVEYNNQNKVHTEKEDHLKGKLLATEKHLENNMDIMNKVLDLIKNK